MCFTVKWHTKMYFYPWEKIVVNFKYPDYKYIKAILPNRKDFKIVGKVKLTKDNGVKTLPIKQATISYYDQSNNLVYEVITTFVSSGKYIF